MPRRVLVLLAVLALASCGGSSAGNQGASASIQVTLLPSSPTHSPNSTWWGYHQSKVVRHGERVYAGIIEGNAGQPSTGASFQVYEIGTESTSLLGSHPSSRPGNVVVDGVGGVHVLTFEPVDAAVNDSVGSLVHTHYVPAPAGGFLPPTRTVVDSAPDAFTETVNIRIGATSGPTGSVTVSYGLNSLAGHAGKVMVLWTWSPSGAWSRRVLEDVGHEYYYPFVVDTGTRVLLLPVQDDWVPGAAPPATAFNRYYKIPCMLADAGSWSMHMLLDVSTDPLAVGDAQPQLVEQSDLFERSDGSVLAIYKDKRAVHGLLGGETRFLVREITDDGMVGDEEELAWAAGLDAAWVRAFEIDGELFFFASAWQAVFVARAATGQVVGLPLAGWPTGAYPYLSSARGGAARNAQPWLDVLAPSGNASNYPAQHTRLYRIPKAAVRALF